MKRNKKISEKILNYAKKKKCDPLRARATRKRTFPFELTDKTLGIPFLGHIMLFKQLNSWVSDSRTLEENEKNWV